MTLSLQITRQCVYNKVLGRLTMSFVLVCVEMCYGNFGRADVCRVMRVLVASDFKTDLLSFLQNLIFKHVVCLNFTYFCSSIFFFMC